VTGAAPPVAQTQQGTWQLQIGCVFYCADTQQVQQAGQSITIINVQTGPSGAVDVTNQIIWQLQIGCVAWCYDTTQVQVISGQSTVILDESPTPPSPPPPPAPPPPPTPTQDPPAPAPIPPAPAQQTGPVPGQAATASASPPAAGPPETTSSPVGSVHLLSAVAWAGVGVAKATLPAATVARVRESALAVAPARTWGTPSVAVHVSTAAAAQPLARRSSHFVARPQPKRRVGVAEARAADPRVPDDISFAVVMLATAAALVALAAIWTQVRAQSER